MTSSPSQQPPPDLGDKRREEGKSGEWAETAVLLAKVSGIGWFVVGSIGIGAGVGYWLDRRFDTAPVITLVGLALGIVVAFRGMLGLVRAVSRSGNKKQ